MNGGIKKNSGKGRTLYTLIPSNGFKWVEDDLQQSMGEGCNVTGIKTHEKDLLQPRFANWCFSNNN